MAEVTDPNLLSQLGGGTEVTDPHLLGQLNASGDSALGTAKQFGAGIAEGATPQHLLGSWVNKSDPLAGENLTSLPAPKPSDYKDAAQNALPEPQGPTERIARGAGSALPMAAGLPVGGLGAFPAAAGLGAVGRASEEVVPGSGPYAALGTGLLGLGAGRTIGGIRRMLKEYKGAPDLHALEASENARWDDVRSLEHKFDPTEVSQEMNNIRSNKIDVHPDRAPETTGMLSRAEDKYAPLSREQGTTAEQRAGLAPLPEKAPVTFDDLDSFRRGLKDIARKGGEEGRAAYQAIHGLYDFMERQPGEVGKMASLARQETAAARRMSAMDALRQRAVDAGGSDKNFRTQLNSFIRPSMSGKNKGLSMAHKEGFNEDEIKELRELGHGSTHNLLHGLGYIFGAGHMGWFGPFGAVMGHPGLFISSMFGKAFQGLSSTVAQARYNRLMRMGATRSPLAKEMGVQGRLPSQIPLRYHLLRTGASIIAPAMGAQRPTQQTFAKGGRVKRSFSWGI